MNIIVFRLRAVFCLFVLFLIVLYQSACSSSTGSGSYYDPNNYSSAIYGDIAKRTFGYEGPHRNPLIVIHGFLGARLKDMEKNENIWGNFSYSEMGKGENFARLAHPMGMGKPLRLLKNDVKAVSLLERSAVEFMGLEFELDNYDRLIQMLQQAGYVPNNASLPHDKNFYSLFIFYYDWRRDISENAVELENFIQQKKAYLQDRYEKLYGLRNYPVKFDVIAHSMGGLLARYYLLYGGTPLPEDETRSVPASWKGAENIDKLVMIGTPNAGYVDTLLELNRGLQLVAASPIYPKALIGTFVSYYQMFPDTFGDRIVYENTGEPVDYFSEKTWIKYNWGILDPAQDVWLKVLLPDVASAQERRAIAIDHLRKCLIRARQFKRAMLPKRVPPKPDHLDFFLIAGDAVLTNQTLAVNPETGVMKVKKQDTGDGKVTSASADFDLRTERVWKWYIDSPIPWTCVFFFQGGHMGIMNSNVFASNLSFLLTTLPPGESRKESVNRK